MAVVCLSTPTWAAPSSVERFGRFEVSFQAATTPPNPYTSLTAEALLTGPEETPPRTVPLFWDGDDRWKFRFSPDQIGRWTWTTRSADAGLNARTGSFEVVASSRAGSLQPMRGFPHHFERQDGSRCWFLGDTAWALCTDNAKEQHDGTAARRYLEARAAQGFNVVHSMLLSEAGWGNAGGPPFQNLGAEMLNPGYWQEVDRRLAHANQQGIVCGLALAWGDKRKQEPYAWRRFPSVEARHRYARYIAARYAAYDVFFIVSGEWHAEIRTRPASEDVVRQEFIALGNTLRAADPHGRMVAIHPMTSHGSVREFNAAAWMSFGDYQQNYRALHGRLLESRRFNKPVVNSEYGYYLRDQDGDGTPDKDNSTSLAAMRQATWDIVMAGGYVVTGFGTTYFGGNRDPGPFDLDAAKNNDWERQIGQIKRCFDRLEYWKLEPHDELVSCSAPRGTEVREFGRTVPPATTYWCLAEPARQYLVYVRGVRDAVEVAVKVTAGQFTARQFNPRTGTFTELGPVVPAERFTYHPPTADDWVVVLDGREQ